MPEVKESSTLYAICIFYANLKDQMNYICLMRWLIFCFLFLQIQMVAQTDPADPIFVEPSIYLGRIIKHTKKFQPEVTENTVGLELDFYKQTTGKNPWNEWHNYPQMGIALTYFRFGDREIFGESFSVLPHLRLRLFSGSKLQFHFRIGAGLAYLSNKYDFQDNPTNNVIGSHFNGTVSFKVDSYYKIHPNWRVLLGTNFTHFSNGGSVPPNLGINVVAINLGFSYSPNPMPRTSFKKSEAVPLRKKLGFDMSYNMALKESIAIGGAKFPVYIGSMALTFPLTRTNKLLLGSEYEFNSATYRFLKHNEYYPKEAEYRAQASRVLVFVGDEFQFGDVSIVVQLGTYLSKSFGQPYPIYNKLAFRYYLPSLKFTNARFYTSVNMKSHLAVAEYISLGGGVSF